MKHKQTKPELEGVNQMHLLLFDCYEIYKKEPIWAKTKGTDPCWNQGTQSNGAAKLCEPPTPRDLQG